MYVIRRLTWIFINVVNLITMHVLSCYKAHVYLGMFRLTNKGIAVFLHIFINFSILRERYVTSEGKKNKCGGCLL
jgi:hypothetical protein